MKGVDRLPIFKSPEQERILAVLFVLANEPLSISELARRSRTSVAGAHKEVERLEEAGLVKSSVVGRNRLVEVEPASPLYSEMRGLLLKTSGPEPLLRSALADIGGVQEAFIFGSWADVTRGSPADIDVLVIGNPDVGVLYDAVTEVESQVGRPINIVIRTEADWLSADGGFERAVKSGPRIDLI